jgi:chromosome segregation ATPase
MEKLNKALNTLQTGTVALQKESYIIETEIRPSKDPAASSDKTSVDNTQQKKAGENLGTAASNVKDTQSKAQQNVTDAGALNKELENKDKNNVDDAKGKQNISKYLTAYNATVEAYGSSITSVFAAMCTAREAMRKDFRSLVRAHVNSYLSDSEGNSTNKTTTATDQGTNVGKQEPNKSPDGTGSGGRTNVVTDRGNNVGETDDAGNPV